MTKSSAGLFPGIAARFDRLDRRITNFMARYAITILRVALGLVFLWFGGLKFFPGQSPAENLAAKTFGVMTFQIFSPQTSLFILAVWETSIGLLLIFNRGLRLALLLLILQMTGTFAPLLLYPFETFQHPPYSPSMEGQYILKNVVLLAAGLVIGATARGGRFVSRR